jgi:hypothetical protein
MALLFQLHTCRMISSLPTPKDWPFSIRIQPSTEDRLRRLASSAPAGTLAFFYLSWCLGNGFVKHY